VIPQLYRSTDPIPAPDRMRYIGNLTNVEKCTSKEQINGDYSLSATISPNDEIIGEIQNQRFLLAKPNPFDPPQYFEVYGADYDEIGRLTLKGRHIKHCANNNITLDLFDTDPDTGTQWSATPYRHWQVITPLLAFDNFFTFSSSIAATAKINVGWTRAGTLGEFFKELAEVFGGEFHYNNFNVDFPLNRGTKKNYVLRWDKNIASPKLSLSTADIYTHVVATANVTIVHAGTPTKNVIACSSPMRITSSTSSLQRIYQFDATSELSRTNYDWSVQADKTELALQLNRSADNFARYSYKNQIQYEQNVNLQLTYRPALDDMREIGLGDTVDVMLKGGRTVEAKITTTTFDCLAERWTAIELGHEKLKLSDYIANRR